LHPLSLIEPLTVAFQRTKRILFEPFSVSKWLRLGFCAFLTGSPPIAALGGGGNTNGASDSNNGPDAIDTFIPWLEEHRVLLITGAALIGLLVLLLGLVLAWLSSRGRFMLLDGVVRNRGAILAPWHDYRREGNSLFRFRFVLALASIAMMSISSGSAFLLMRKTLSKGEVNSGSVVVVVVCFLVLVAWFLLMELISILLLDFVAPVMYLHRLPVLPAGKLVMRSLVKERPGSVLLYLVARFLINSLLGMVSLIVILLTCCIGFIPYIGSVILLPLTIFQITYPLAFLAQLGPQWRLLPQDRQPPQPTANPV
jgi:hypothetical protein